MGGCLKNLVIASVGDLGPDKRPNQLRKWVEANGGRWIAKVQKGITHLVADKESWKKGVNAVKQAKQLSGVWIVDYNWLEDSLQKRRKLAEKKYTWEVLRKQRRLAKTMKRVGTVSDTKKFRDGCAKALEDTGTGTSSKVSSRTPGHFVSAFQELEKKRRDREARAEQTSSSTGDHDPVPLAVQASGLDYRQQVIGKPSIIHNEPTKPSKTKLSRGPKPASKPTAKKPNSGVPISSLASHSSVTQDTSTQPPVATKNQKLTDLYHVYTDVTGFSHDLSFTRHNPILNTTAKYDLRLYESNTKPHVYCTFIRYIPPSDALNKASTTINNPQAQTSSESEAARLQALVNSPTQVPNISELPQSPTSDKLYKTVLSPPNSPFDKSFQTFRHAFQDLTLLPWEERTHHLPSPSPLMPFYHQTIPQTHPQRQLAESLNTEPFLWNNIPFPGSPSGTFPLLPAPIQNAGNGYARNSFSPPLPALEAPLSPSSGAIGSAIAREEHERARREEEVKNQERERMRLANREKARERERLRAKGRAALFNGVNGPPVRTPLGNPPSLARSSSALPPSNRAASLAAGEERYGRGASMGASSWTPMAYGAGSRSPGAAGGLMRPPDGLAPRLNPAVFTQFPKVGKRTTKFWDER